MHWAAKAALAAGGFIVLRELYIAFGPRRSRREEVYKQAAARAQALGRPLLVIGDPAGGILHRTLGPDYGCGDQCLAQRGCPSCAHTISGPIPVSLARMPSNSAVIFVADVLEQADDIHALLTEMSRVSGGNLFAVTIEPVTLAAWLSPGAKRRFFQAPPVNGDFVWTPLPWVQELPAMTAPQAPRPTPPPTDYIDVDGEPV